MTTTRTGPAGAGRQLRADARKNIAAIIDAATDCLARDPDASVSEIAKAAGVGRVTLYGHFDSRATLVAAVVDRAMAESDAALRDLDLTGDPAEALERLIHATWRITYRYGALVVAAERAMPDAELAAAHSPHRERAEGLIERGRAEGRFRVDVPASWLITVLHTVVHAAANAVHARELSADDAPRMITATMLGVTTPPGDVVPHPAG